MVKECKLCRGDVHYNRQAKAYFHNSGGPGLSTIAREVQTRKVEKANPKKYRRTETVPVRIKLL